MKKNSFYLLLVCMLYCASCFSQDDEVLKSRLRGKTRFDEIMMTVTNYFKDPATASRLSPQVLQRELKHWQRFEWYMGRRLGPNGEFVNINKKMIEATGLQRADMNSSRTESTTGTWTPIGPMNTDFGIGRADRLAFHPTDPDIVYAGTTAGGLWKTTNGGTNWTNISADIPSAGISGILIDPVNTNTLYILTGDGDSDFGGLVENYGYMRLSIGVLKSTNGGATWSQTGVFPGADYSTLTGYRMVMHPTDHNTIYACTSQGIFMSINAGDSWGLVSISERFFNMKFKPGSGNVCYAISTDDGYSTASFWKSTTSGITWSTSVATNNLINSPTRRVELAVSPADPGNVYLLGGGTTAAPGFFQGLFLSTNDGQSFNMQSNSPNIVGRLTTGLDNAQQSNYDLCIAVSNLNAGVVMTGAVNPWHTPNVGFNNTWNFRGNNIHGDVHDLGFHPADNKLWAATDGGVFSSTDLGVNWTSHFESMNTTQFYRMAVSPADYNNLIAGAQDNAVKRKTGATTYFEQIACCDGFALGYDFSNANTIYAVTNQVIRVSLDGGNNFTAYTPPNTVIPFSMSMAPHTSQSGTLYIGTDKVMVSNNNGVNWNTLSFTGGAWYLKTCPSNGSRIYVAGGDAYNTGPGTLRRSDNSGTSWTTISNTTNFPLTFPRITCINVDPTNSSNVWVTLGGFNAGDKVFYSNNAGASWINRSGSLPNVPVNCIALDNNNNAYIGTDNGVYYKSTSMTDWVPFYNNLPYVPVTDLVISEAENRIRAATFGRGIWSSDLYSACPADITVSGTLEGQEFYEASNSITSTATLLTSTGTKVLMRGGNEVLLQANFSAKENSVFKAMIGPCGSGGIAGFRMQSIDTGMSIPPKQFLPVNDTKATIHIASFNSNEIRYEINQKAAGNVDVLMTDKEGKIMKTAAYENNLAGKSNQIIYTGGLSKGTYYLQLLVNKRVEHLQEVIIE
jgi:photosystem II stability/assembly factor-like uncharacterized protein